MFYSLWICGLVEIIVCRSSRPPFNYWKMTPFIGALVEKLILWSVTGCGWWLAAAVVLWLRTYFSVCFIVFEMTRDESIVAGHCSSITVESLQY